MQVLKVARSILFSGARVIGGWEQNLVYLSSSTSSYYNDKRCDDTWFIQHLKAAKDALDFPADPGVANFRDAPRFL